jgi:hypothetical protein
MFFYVPIPIHHNNNLQKVLELPYSSTSVSFIINAHLLNLMIFDSCNPRNFTQCSMEYKELLFTSLQAFSSLLSPSMDDF